MAPHGGDHPVAETVFALVRVELLAHLAFAAFAATGVGYMIKQARVHGPYRWPLLAILLIPNFGVWSAVIGRESLFVGLLGFFLGAVLSYWRRPAFRHGSSRCFASAACRLSGRPTGSAWHCFLMFLIYRSGPRVRLSMGVQAIFFAGVFGFVLALVWPYLDGYITGEVLPKARGYFTTKSETTRTWVYIDTTANLLTSLWWSLPLALVGPTPGEVAARPLMFPFFLSGLVVLGSWLYSVGVAFRVQSSRERKILLLGWLPAALFILIAYVPFGIYNSGSAIRYASCFLLFLIFPSMLLSAMSAEAIYADSRPRKPEAGRLPRIRIRFTCRDLLAVVRPALRCPL